MSTFTARVQIPDPEGYPEHPITIGEHIKKRRMDLGLYQADMTRMLGVTKDCVGYWERGITDPHIKYVPAIIAFLGYYPFDHETETFGGKLTRYKNEHGYSNERAAEVFGVDECTVAKWVRNKCLPLARSMEKVLEIIDTLQN